MKPKAMARRLQRRQAAHAAFMKQGGLDSKVASRRDSGGYRCPGSPKQN